MMKISEYLEAMLGEEALEGLLTADGFDDALIGIGERINLDSVAVYDVDKCIDILMSRDGMSREEAVEFFDFNVKGSWVGEKTPIWVYMNPYYKMSYDNSH
tara:strand:+ start:1981 stop:2283 length:303 start_codon:yes stop_codon:yes gene_type:complete